MREIRSRIAERGVELSDQQIQELAARRLEAVLDPSSLKPSLMDELRRAAGMAQEPAAAEAQADVPPAEATLWESSNPVLRFLRRISRPLLTLLINQKALAERLDAQTRATNASALRDQEQRRRQAEWNGLHYEIIRRLATDLARAEIDARDLALRVESLAAKVDFNERRVRGLEQALHQAKSVPRIANLPAPPPPSRAGAETQAEQSSPEGGMEGARRRRRRRRGRRAGPGSPMAEVGTATTGETADVVGDDAENAASGAEALSQTGEDSSSSRDPGSTGQDAAGPAETSAEGPPEDSSARGEPTVDPSPVQQDLLERPPLPPSDPE